MRKKPNQPTNSDTPWKDVLEYFFQDFVSFCLPDLYPCIDWRQPVEFLDKELHAITKDNLTKSRIVDKLVKVFLNSGKEQWIYFHIDVQGKPQKIFPERMLVYGYRIYDKYQKPVISCAILTDANPKWRPNYYEVGFGGSRLRLDFLVIKLVDFRKRLDELEASQNPFASVILSHLAMLEVKKASAEKRLLVKLNLTRRLYKKGFNKEQVKRLYLFIDWLFNLPAPLEIQYQYDIHQFEEVKKMAYVSNIEQTGIKKGFVQGMEKGLEKGIEKGREEGMEKGEAFILTRQLKHRFGPLPETYQKRIEKANSKTLLKWADRIFDIQDIKELFK